jgi:hypothetical protein
MKRENTSAPVPARDKQAEEDLWQRHKAERGVWTEPMLVALERGLKGNRVGTGIEPAPPTPPGMRFRTGRFQSVTC